MWQGVDGWIQEAPKRGELQVRGYAPTGNAQHETVQLVHCIDDHQYQQHVEGIRLRTPHQGDNSAEAKRHFLRQWFHGDSDQVGECDGWGWMSGFVPRLLLPGNEKDDHVGRTQSDGELGEDREQP